jgi:3-oxoacyl-[acyl-carrier-protein] synthase-3
MAANAARIALARAGIQAEALDVIIAASSAPQQMLPCTAALVQRELGCPDGAAACFDINASCLSFHVALSVSADMIANGGARTALLVSAEITGRSLNPREPESAALLGDAAAAALVTALNERGHDLRNSFRDLHFGC